MFMSDSCFTGSGDVIGDTGNAPYDDYSGDDHAGGDNCDEDDDSEG